MEVEEKSLAAFLHALVGEPAGDRALGALADGALVARAWAAIASDAAPFSTVEALLAARWEGALHVDDVLTRRTRMSIESTDRGIAAAPVVARILAGELGWDDATVAREVEAYRTRVAAEIDSQRADDDRTADERRLGAPDLRAGAR